MKLSELAFVVGGELIGLDCDIASFSTDTRSLQAGDLFIAGDTTGQGHRTRVIDGPALVIFIPVPARAFREQTG